VSKTFGEWYQKTNKNRRYKLINFIGLQNNRHPSQHTVRRTAAIQQRLTAVLRSIPKEAFADSFQKLYGRCQSCVKDGNYKANKVN
jgi:hypothetical protein